MPIKETHQVHQALRNVEQYIDNFLKMLAIVYRQRRLILVISALILTYKLWNWKSDRTATDANNQPEEPHSSSSKKFKSRIVAVGDLHGDLSHAVRVLRLAGLINLRNEWIGKRSILVQTGDIVDRGKDTILLYQLMDRLRGEASRAGGAVVNLLGNHEVSNFDLLHECSWRLEICY